MLAGESAELVLPLHKQYEVAAVTIENRARGGSEIQIAAVDQEVDGKETGRREH